MSLPGIPPRGRNRRGPNLLHARGIREQRLVAHPTSVLTAGAPLSNRQHASGLQRTTGYVYEGDDGTVDFTGGHLVVGIEARDEGMAVAALDLAFEDVGARQNFARVALQFVIRE